MKAIGKYDIVKHLATGGMGEVFLARQSGPAGFNRTVVLKRLLPHLAREPAFVQMFLNEARVVSMLSHPNIAQIYELGQDGDTFYIAMEFVHGRSLQHITRELAKRERLLAPALVVRIAAQALKGLHHAHTLKVEGAPSPVVHRDMSPDNILVGFNGLARVIDFGIARAADTVSTTRTGTVKGKFAYMAPERFANETTNEVDARVDVYAVGVVLYECLTGERPFRGNSDAALVGAILHGTALPAQQVRPSVPAELSAIVAKALAHRPSDRFGSAEEFALALEQWLATSKQPVDEAMVAAFMRGLYGAEADSNPALARPSAPELATETGSVLPRSRQWLLVLPGVTVLVLGAVGAWLVSRPAGGPAVPPVVAPVVDAGAGAATVVPDGPKGRVSFRVKPWGEIWLGEERLGVTPNVLIEKPAGRYTFTVKNPEFSPRQLAVEVIPGSEVAVKVDLTQGG